MDRSQLLNSPEMTMRAALTGWQSGMWTAMPAIVQSVDFTKMTLVAQIAIQGVITNADLSQTKVDISPLVDVPICFPSAGGFSLTFPIEIGDEILVVLASRCIDAWWQNGGYQNVPMETRMHDLSDGFAIPGPKSLPNVIPSISSSAAQLRNDEGTVYLGLTDSGLFQMKNSEQSLKLILNTLNEALITFSTGLTPANLIANSAALVASLTTLTLDISELLE